MKLDTLPLIVKRGDTTKYDGCDVISDRYRWDDFFLGEKRTAKANATNLELGQAFGTVAVWNPFGTATPMLFDQCTRLRTKALQNPLDADLQARADVHEFMVAGAAAPYQIFTYVGCPRTMKPKTGETHTQWYNRALLELRPLTFVSHTIGLDATHGYGRHPEYEFFDIAEPQLIKRLKKAVSELAIEPFAYVGSDYVARLSKLTTDSQLRIRARKQDWATIHGKGAYVPGVFGEPTYVVLDELTGTTPQARVDYINAAQQRHPKARLIVNYNDFHSSMLDAV